MNDPKKPEPLYLGSNLPTLLTVRDVLVILTAVVAIAAAFFMYDTRITVLENEIRSIRTDIQEIKNKQKDMSNVTTEIAQQSIKLQNIEKSQDRLEIKLERMLDKK